MGTPLPTGAREHEHGLGHDRGLGRDRTVPMPCEMIENLAFDTDGGIAQRARIGMVVLATDNTIEHELRQVVGSVPGVALFHARIHNSATVTPETLAAMEGDIARTTDLILPGVPLDVVGFGCTAATMILGEARVFELITSVRPGARATTPITAAFAAFDAFGARRIGVLTPYPRDVNEIVRGYIEAHGYDVPVFGSFNESDDNRVARISAASIRRAIDTMTRDRQLDMVFVSCTSLRLAAGCADVENDVGLPVTSSSHAIGWHALRLAGIDDPDPRWGRLFERPLPTDAA